MSERDKYYMTQTNKPIDIPLQYNSQTKSIYWSEKSINDFYITMLYRIAEYQKYELLEKIFLTEQFKKIEQDTLLNNLLIKACDLPNKRGNAIEDSMFVKNNVSIVSFLLKKGADPNCKGKDGIPIIFSLIQNNNLLAVKKMVEYGVNLNVKRYDQTPAEWADALNFQEVALYLKGKMK